MEIRILVRQHIYIETGPDPFILQYHNWWWPNHGRAKSSAAMVLTLFQEYSYLNTSRLKDNILEADDLCPLLLIWFNFNPSMDK